MYILIIHWNLAGCNNDVAPQVRVQVIGSQDPTPNAPRTMSTCIHILTNTDRTMYNGEDGIEVMGLAQGMWDIDNDNVGSSIDPQGKHTSSSSRTYLSGFPPPLHPQSAM